MPDGAGGKEVGRISIRVLPDTSKFRARLKEQLERVEKALSATVSVDADLNVAGVKTRFKAMMADLRAQAANGVDINVGIDRSQFGQLTSGVAGLTKGLSGLGGIAGSAGESMAGLGRNGALVAAVLAAIAPAVGLVSGLLAGLPSLLTAGVAGAGAIALGLDGIKASAAKLTPDLDALKASVSGVFEQRLTPIFDQLKTVFPVLQTGMQSVASGLSDMFQGVTNAVTSGTGLAQIQTILTNVSGLFSQMQPVVQSFTGSFLTLATAGSEAFGHLTGPLQTFATQFGDLVTRITSNGAFDSAMQGLSQTLGSVLNLFNRLFESGVTAMGQLGGPLSTAIQGIGDMFVAAMPALTGFTSFIAEVGGSLLTALAPAVKAISGPLQEVFNVFGNLISTNITSLGPIFTEIGTALGTTLTEALKQIAPMLPGLMDTFAQLAQTVSGELKTVLPQLATSFGSLAGAMMKIAPSVLQGLADAFIKLAPELPNLASLLPTVANAFTAFLGAVTPLIPQIVQLAVQALQLTPSLIGIAPVVLQIVGALGQLVNTVISAGQSIVEFVSKAVSEVGALPGKILTAIGNLGNLLFSAGRDLIFGFIGGIKSMVTTAVEAVKGVANSVIGAAKSVLGINSPSTVFAQIGKFTGQGFIDGLSSQHAAMLKTAGDMAGDVSDEFREKMDAAAAEAFNVPFDFAKATGGQILSDLGVQGGAVQGLADQLMDWGMNAAKQPNQFVFHVSNVDEAIAVKNNQINKQSLTWRGR